MTLKIQNLEKDWNTIIALSDLDERDDLHVEEAFLASEIMHLKKISANVNKNTFKAKLTHYGKKPDGIWSKLRKVKWPRDVMLQVGHKVVWCRRDKVTQGRIGKGQGTEVLLWDGGDTRSSLHPSMVTLECLDEEDKRGNRQGHYLSWLSLSQARMLQLSRILRDETWASQSIANKGSSQNWNK